jgi:hypothetical protein
MPIIEQNGGGGGNVNSLIRSVRLIESLASYILSDLIIPVTIDAVSEKNKMIILRIVGSLSSNTHRLSHQLLVENLDLLKNGESIIIKCEQKEGLGNVDLQLLDSSNYLIKQFTIAPAGTYLITRNAYTIGAESGYTFVTLDDGSSHAFEVTSGFTNRHVGFGVYSVSGSGAVVTPQILIPAANVNTPTDKVVIVNYGSLCRIETVDTDPIYDAFGSSISHDISKGVYIFQYAKNKIYIK